MTIVTPNDLYTTGTISLTNGSDIVTGDGTFWTAVALRGDALWIADRSLLVKEVLADDQIRIAAPWGGATVADQPYALSYSSWLRYSIAELQGGVRDVLAFWRMGGVRGTRTVSLPTDAITVDDLSKVVVYDSAAPVAVSIPQASADGKLVDGWACWIKVIGAGAVTITPTVSTINETASLALAQGDTAMLWSHGGNYLAAVLRVGKDGDDGAPGATIMVQDAEPATSYPPGSLWIDQDSADLDVYQLGGDPLAWTDTGVNLKGPQGDPGTDGTDGTDGADGVNGINGASALTVVRTAATANVNIASALENGDAVSGVTLATNDLVLLTAQTAPAENGIYVVAASGAASRHASFASYDAHPGCYFSVCEGTGVADTLWRCTSDRGGTLGSTALAFSQFSAGAAGRELLTANRTYYVRPDGNDSNNGLANTSGGAFLTVQKAYDTICANLDLAGYAVTIQLADGTYAPPSGTNALLASKAWTGGGEIVVQGNSTTPANVVISTTNANAVMVTAPLPGLLTLKDFKIQTATSGDAISLQAAGNLRFGNMNFGASAGAHLNTNAPGAKITAISGYTISGGAQHHAGLSGQSTIAIPVAVTLTGTPNFSVRFVNAIGLAYLDCSAASFSGAATGVRYGVFINAVIFSNGGSSTFFPGNAAGVSGTGGIYS